MAKKKPKKKVKKLAKNVEYDTEAGLGDAIGISDRTSSLITDGVSPRDLFKQLSEKIQEAISNVRPNWVATRCGNCNLKLNIPKAEATRCVLCGNEKLEISERPLFPQ